MAAHSQYTKELATVAVAQICQTVGWNSSLTTPLNILTHIMDGYFQEVAKNIHRYSDHYGHGTPTLDDVMLAFYDMGISGTELENYLENVSAVAPAVKVPKYPVHKESHLRFLKPGSREVVTRPVHVHEHLPAMYPELEEESYPMLNLDNPGETFKRPGDPISGNNESKKMKIEEECLPLREVLSVMMTTSGFLSPAREGKLPESRMPVLTSDCRSSSPSSHSYPNVPPEVKGDLRKMKKKSHEIKSEALQDDSNVQKLISMKETSKLKAFKTGMKHKVEIPGVTPGHHPTKKHKEHKHKEHHHHHHHHHHKNKDKSKDKEHKEKDKEHKEHKEKEKEHREKEKDHKENELHEKEVAEKALMPKEQMANKKELGMEVDSDTTTEKLFEVKDQSPSTPIEKIAAEPDKQKLNIFKKLQSKPKDEKEIEIEKDKLKEAEKEKEREQEKEKEREREREREQEKEREREREKEREREREREKEKEREREKDREREREKEKERERELKLKKKKEKELEKMKHTEEDDQAVVKSAIPFQFPHFPGVSGPGLIPAAVTPNHPLLARLPSSLQHPLIPQPIVPLTLSVKSKDSEDRTKDSVSVSPSNKISTHDGPTKADKTLGESGKKEKSDHIKKDKKEHKKKDKEKLKKKKKDKNKEKNKATEEKIKEKTKEEEKIVEKEKDKVPEKPEEKEKEKDKEVKEKEKESGKEKEKKKDKDKKDKKKEKLKKKKKDKEKSGHEKDKEVLPKLTFKFGSANEAPKQPEAPKITIKPILENPPPATESPYDDSGFDTKQVWICPGCGQQDDGSPMIGCDGCDAWYHWTCVGLIAEPESSDWFCPKCSKAESKKKRGRKKKGHHDQ